MEIWDELARRLNPAHVLEDPGVVESIAYVDLLALFGLFTVVGLLLSTRPHLLVGQEPFRQQLTRRYGAWLAWLGGAGLLAIGLRYTAAPFFSKRIWLILNLLGIGVLAAHFLWYRFTRYSHDLAQQAEDERHRRSRSTAAGRPRRTRRR